MATVLYCLLGTVKLIMLKIKRKLRAILDIIKSDKFFLATFKENNELDWWTEYNITRDVYIDKL